MIVKKMLAKKLNKRSFYLHQSILKSFVKYLGFCITNLQFFEKNIDKCYYQSLKS